MRYYLHSWKLQAKLEREAVNSPANNNNNLQASPLKQSGRMLKKMGQSFDIEAVTKEKIPVAKLWKKKALMAKQTLNLYNEVKKVGEEGLGGDEEVIQVMISKLNSKKNVGIKHLDEAKNVAETTDEENQNKQGGFLCLVFSPLAQRKVN